MKSIFTIILAVSCVVMLVLGNTYWDKKTSAFNQPSPTKAEDAKKEDVEKEEVKAEDTAEKEETVEETEPSEKNNELLTFTKNWPTAASELFNKRLTAHEPLHFVIIGSQAIGTVKSGWANLLDTQLIETYGEENIQVTINPFDTTSTKFIADRDYAELVKQKADVVLFEPFTLNDNGFIPTTNSLKNITTFMGELKKTNPETTFILLPPHPIYNAKFYPKQVAELASYAKENKIPYLDHWSAWPSDKSVNIKNYLLPDQSAPNEKGNQLLADYLTNYFISK